MNELTRSTAPAVEPLSDYKQQNQIHSVKILHKGDTSRKKMRIKNQSLMASRVAEATILVMEYQIYRLCPH